MRVSKHGSLRLPHQARTVCVVQELWLHGAEHDINREDAVGSSRRILKELVGQRTVAALCASYRTCVPGLIREGGRIDHGAQNLPGN
jgi:hypothetical protein